MADDRPPLNTFIQTERPPLGTFGGDAASFTERFDAVEGADPNAIPVGGAIRPLGEAIKNIPSSGWNAAKDIYQTVRHPVETAENIGKIGLGVGQELGLKEGDEYKKYPEAVAQFFKDRYGSFDKAVKTFEKDPVGVAMDLSTVLSGGETALARAPGIVGKVGEVAGAASRAVDPVRAAGAVAAPVAKGVGEVAAKVSGDLLTRTGPEAVRLAATSGYEGGEAGKSFREHLGEAAPREEVVKEARTAVGNMRRERGQEYRSGMHDISKDKTILSFNEIDKGIADAEMVGTFKGELTNEAAAKVREAIKVDVEHWKNLQASEFWTPEGFDALKKKVGEYYEKTEAGTPARKVVDDIYNEVKNSIVKQAPEYAKIMKGYDEASEQIKQIEQTLTGKKDANIDTSLRKLQSTLRDNVNTNYGQRRELAKYLVESGAPHLMEKLAGQALSSWFPRGLGKSAMVGEAGGAGLAAALSHPLVAAGLATGAAASSPKLAGQVAHTGGRVARGVEKLPGKGAAVKGAYQAGRADRAVSEDALKQSVVDMVERNLP